MHQDFMPPGIVILTGAGISKESGIDTFRDKDGLWTRVNLEEVATIEAWYRDKKNVIHMHGRDGEIRCMNCSAVFESEVDLTPQSVCPNCQAVGELRHHIVWFG